MLNLDSKSAYSIINARHQDTRNIEEARRFARALQVGQPGRVRSAIKGVIRFARHLNGYKASQQVTEVQVRLNQRRHA